MKLMSPEDIMVQYRPGSQDEDWTWEDEEKSLGSLSLWEQTVLIDGLPIDDPYPITLGSDGRVWDGHHRIITAHRLGLESVPVDMIDWLED